MNAETQAAFSALGLPTTATAEDVAAAHRKLARTWHPDRFPDNPRMKANAQVALAKINNARDLLKVHFQLVSRLNTTRVGQYQPSEPAKPPADPDRERQLMMTVSITFLIIIASCCFGVMFMYVSSPLAMLAATLLCMTSVSALVVFLVNLMTKNVMN